MPSSSPRIQSPVSTLCPPIETGTPIGGILTPSLLNTIFYPGSALHDMGVVVRQGLIAAAGCQFPLAESDDIVTVEGDSYRLKESKERSARRAKERAARKKKGAKTTKKRARRG